MKMEVTSLAQAMEAFKERFGRYPPDGSSNTAVKAFLAAVFPRYTGNWPLPGMPSLTPSTAFVFWLGGMQDANGAFIGLSQPGKPVRQRCCPHRPILRL